jgi:hypothetical protein
MPKHQIFLVHGMGEFEPGWSGAIQLQFKALFEQYPSLSADRIGDAFELKELNYAQVFEKWRKQWREDANAAAGALTAVGLDSGEAQKLVKLAGAPTGNSFWQTHVLDVVFYRFLLPISQEVCRELQTQILGHLDAFADPPLYSIVAHSLGAAVAYEAMHAMLTESPPLPSTFRPINFCAISNPARLLWGRGGDVYTPTLGPSFMEEDGMCMWYFDAGHQLDPVCRVMPFHKPPPRWFSRPASAGEVYAHCMLPAGDVQALNIHALEHYLGHPSVHVPMLRSLAGFDGAISKQEENAALLAWRKKTLGAAALKKAQASLQAIATRQTDDWESEVGMLLDLRTLVGNRADGETS